MNLIGPQYLSQNFYYDEPKIISRTIHDAMASKQFTICNENKYLRSQTES